MTETRRTVVLSVKDDYSRQLRQYAQQMAEAGRATDNLSRIGGQSFWQMSQNLFFMAQNVQMVYGAMRNLLNTAQEWGRLGAQVERSEYALRVYAGSAQEAERWQRAIVEAMRGTVTEGEAAAQAYMLMKFGLADTAQEAGEFARMLTVVAAANPQLGGTQNALLQIQLTLANTSFMRLDQLGLSAMKVRQRMEELKQETPELTREVAFQQAVLEGLKEQADRLGEGMMGVTLRQDQLAAKSRAFKETVGRTVNETLERAAGAALDLYNTLTLLTQHPYDVSVAITYATAAEVTGSNEPTPSVEDLKNALAIGLNAAIAMGAMKLGVATRQEATAAMAEQLFNLGIVPRPTPNITPAPLMPGEWGGLWQPSGGGTGFPATRDMQAQAQLMRRIRQDVLRAQLYNFRYSDIAMGISEGLLSPLTARSWRLPTPEEQELLAEQLKRFRTRPGIMEAFRAFQQEQLAAQLRTFRGADIASLQAVGGVLPASMMGITGVANIAERLQEALQPTAAMQKALQQMADAADRANKSLRDIWGIAPTAFDASLYDEAAKALNDYGVSAEKSDEAMRYMALTTGEANAQSEIFGLRARAAAEALDKGELSAAGFAVQMGLLAREDWSWVDRLMKVPDTEEGLRRYVDVIERLASGELRQAVGEVPDQIAELQRQFSGEAAAPEVDPFQTMIERLQEVEGQSETTFSEMEGDMVAWVDLSTLRVRGWREDFIQEIKEVETKLGEFTGRPWKVTITTSFGGGEGEGEGLGLGGPTVRGGFQTFQRGGYTGDGPPQQIAGLVHRGEFVISQDMLRAMRRSPRLPVIMPGQGGGITITGPIHVHGVQNPAQLLEALEREAGRRNLRLTAARD